MSKRVNGNLGKPKTALHKEHVSEGMKKRYAGLKIAKAFYEAHKDDYGDKK